MSKENELLYIVGSQGPALACNCFIFNSRRGVIFYLVNLSIKCLSFFSHL